MGRTVVVEMFLVSHVDSGGGDDCGWLVGQAVSRFGLFVVWLVGCLFPRFIKVLFS